MRHAVSTALAALLLFCATANAYVFLGQVWPDGSIVMHPQAGSSGGALIDGSSSWDESAEGALATWNQYLGRVRFQVIRGTTTVGDGNGVNNVFWSSTIYSRAFDSNVLAVATNWSRGTTRVEADVVFNNSSARSWNSYSGPLRSASSGGTLIDFRRVALHEFGHVLGLNHPDQAGQTVSSVMRSNTGDIDRLQPDDIAGVQALYSGTAPTPVPASAPGAPSSLVVSATGSSVSLSWRGPTTGSTPSTYVVEAGATPGAANLANVTTGSTSTSFSATGVGAGVYYVRVKARNSVGTSGASNEATLIVGGGSGPCSGAPSAPGALFVTGNSGGTVSFSWSASSGSPTTYIIEAGSTPGTANLANSDLGGPATTFTASGVGRGTYYVRLRAKNACGTSGVSNEVTLIVP